MQRVRISEIAAPDMDNINRMCVMPGSDSETTLTALRESLEAHRQASPMGAKVFGAFLEGGEPVGRIEIMPVEAVFSLRCLWIIQQYRTCLSIAGSISDKVVTHEYPIRTHTDALRLGEENLYVDGVAPFSGPVRRRELKEVIRKHLEAKGLP
jgi:hypothetical protein